MISPACLRRGGHWKGRALTLVFDVKNSVAGSETSSTAMTHTPMFLVKNPKKLVKLQEDLDLATTGNPNGYLPTYDQVRNLEYLTASINESIFVPARTSKLCA